MFVCTLQLFELSGVSYQVSSQVDKQSSEVQFNKSVLFTKLGYDHCAKMNSFCRRGKALLNEVGNEIIKRYLQ